MYVGLYMCECVLACAIYVSAFVCVCVHLHACSFACVHMYFCMSECILVCIFPWVGFSMYACMYVCISLSLSLSLSLCTAMWVYLCLFVNVGGYALLCVGVHACVCVCVRERERERVCVCVRACARSSVLYVCFSLSLRAVFNKYIYNGKHLRFFFSRCVCVTEGMFLSRFLSAYTLLRLCAFISLCAFFYVRVNIGACVCYCIHVCNHFCACTFLRTYGFVFVGICLCLGAFVYAYILSLYLYVWIYVCMHVYVPVCFKELVWKTLFKNHFHNLVLKCNENNPEKHVYS